MNTTARRPLVAVLAAVAALLVAGLAALVVPTVTSAGAISGASRTTVSHTAAGTSALSLAASAPDAAGTGRPANGAVLRSNGRSGEGEAVIAGGAEDAVVTFASRGRTVRAVYVRAGEKPRLVGVPDGSYQVFTVTGSGYSRATHRFDHVTRADRYSDPIEFTTDAQGVTLWNLSVDPVPGGTADTDVVTPTDVPA